MDPYRFFSAPVMPDYEGLVNCLMRRGSPQRVHHMELFMDTEVQDALVEKFSLGHGLDSSRPEFPYQRHLAIQQFLGYDYVAASLEGLNWQLFFDYASDTAALAKSGGRNYINLHTGPIQDWEGFERYAWPEVADASARGLEWYSKHLPENMGIVCFPAPSHFAEHISWLMGYECSCLALCENRELVAAIAQRLVDYAVDFTRRILAFDRVKIVFGSDDMGFRTGTLYSPEDLREFVLPGHKQVARMCHDAGRLYLLHSCGNLDAIMEELIEDVQIDAKHSFEDVILPVTEAKRRYGNRIALIGGIDVDFLCRADEAAVRARVRETLDHCHSGGGYCLGTGNSVANYIPLRNYLAMLDEGRRYAA